MGKNFSDQGGFSSSNPSPLVRWAVSKVMRRIASEEAVDGRRAKVEKARRKAGRAHVVEYFHQVADGYSHLAAQFLVPLLERYDIELVCHLVPASSGANAPEPDMLARLSSYDAVRIAPHYGLRFPSQDVAESELVHVALSALAGIDSTDFAQLAPQVGEAAWEGSKEAMQTATAGRQLADAETVRRALEAGAARRKKLGHYSSAMFHYGGEWYWGVDRLYHLEQRLSDLGARKLADANLLAPRPTMPTPERRDDGSLVLEFFPSIRSPYTAIAFDQTVELAKSTGVELRMRPVLPMVMRGVPATRAKGVYIFSDSAREARAAGLDWGRFYDPIGKPVERCYAIYPWAVEQGRGTELLSAFMRAAFFEGVNTNAESGLRHVVESAGLDWAEAQTHLADGEWEDIIEANRQAMYELGLWGVPSYHLIDADGETALAVWGQDRLWLVAREIQRLLERT